MAASGMRFRAIVSAIFLGALASQPSFGQLYSRPASIVLIATLESLSVSATPLAPAVSQAGEGTADSHLLTITTSWAVPANRTTLRMVGSFSTASPALWTAKMDPSIAPMAAAPSRAETSVPDPPSNANCTAAMQSGDAERMLMNQGAGDTNRADSRTDHIDLIFGKNQIAGAGSGGSSATLSIRVEAL